MSSIILLLATGFMGYAFPVLEDWQNDAVFADHGDECPEGYVEVSVRIGKDETHCVRNEEGFENNVIINYVRGFIWFLSGGVGLVVMLMIIIGGVQYITARDNPQAVQAAKQKIFNAIIALVLFILMYAILSYLVPYGIF